MTSYPARYRPPAGYVRRYRPGRRGGGSPRAEMIAGLAIGSVLFFAAGTGTAVTVTRHKAPAPETASPPARKPKVRAVPVTSAGEQAFFRAVLADMGAPRTGADLRSLAAWTPRETGWPPHARWNPLDSTIPEPGDTWFNTFGGGLHVRNYPSAAEGAGATALTLEDGRYPRITAALKAGTGLCGTRFAADFQVWDGGTYKEIC